MITIQNTTLYKCEYCRKKYEVKSACENHIPYCPKNPENKHKCFQGCANLIKTEKRVDIGDSWGREPLCTFFTCKVTGVEMYSYIAERLGLGIALEGERMPLKCESYIDKCLIDNSNI